MVHIATLIINSGDKIYLSKIDQIAYQKIDKALIKILSKYTDFVNIFLSKLAVKLFKYKRVNNYTIELIDNQQPFYSLIYSLSSVKLETLKISIKNNLANNFIRPSKSLIEALIFFNKKLAKNLQSCVDY